MAHGCVGPRPGSTFASPPPLPDAGAVLPGCGPGTTDDAQIAERAGLRRGTRGGGFHGPEGSQRQHEPAGRTGRDAPSPAPQGAPPRPTGLTLNQLSSPNRTVTTLQQARGSLRGPGRPQRPASRSIPTSTALSAGPSSASSSCSTSVRVAGFAQNSPIRPARSWSRSSSADTRGPLELLGELGVGRHAPSLKLREQVQEQRLRHDQHPEDQRVDEAHVVHGPDPLNAVPLISVSPRPPSRGDPGGRQPRPSRYRS